MTNYPSEGARISAETGKSKREHVLDEATLPEGHRTAVSLEANRIVNSSPGWLPSHAASEAVRRYRAGLLTDRLGENYLKETA